MPALWELTRSYIVVIGQLDVLQPLSFHQLHMFMLRGHNRQ